MSNGSACLSLYLVANVEVLLLFDNAYDRIYDLDDIPFIVIVYGDTS